MTPDSLAARLRPGERRRRPEAEVPMRLLLAVLIGLACALPGAASAQTEPDAAAYRQDALSIEPLINSQYAYLDRFPGGVMPMSPVLRAEAEAVADRSALLR